jgi:hypothetical protein
MLAMSFLLAVFEPATTAASMAIGRPGTIDDAPVCGPERSGGCRRGDFLASRGMGVSPGEESRLAGVAAQAIEAKPIPGQIKPRRGQVRACAERHPREKTWRTSIAKDKRRRGLSVEKESVA